MSARTARRHKRPHEEEHENHERWLVSYADFITLLFAFFVVLYATSRVDNKKLVQVVSSIRFATHFKGSGGIERQNLFEGPPTEGGRCRSMPNGLDQRPLTKKQEEAQQLRKRIERRLKRYLQTRPETHVQIEVDKDRLAPDFAATRALFTKSIVAGTALSAGTVIERRHLAFKKPGTGMAASRVEEVVGRRLTRAIAQDEQVREADLETKLEGALRG